MTPTISDADKLEGEFGANPALVNHARAGHGPTGVDQGERFYVDCEFDGHGGALLSIAMVREDGSGLHVETTETASDPWVMANVVPLMGEIDAHHYAVTCARVPLNDVGGELRAFIGSVEQPVIVADSPVDIGRFCTAISTGSNGGWASADYPAMRFEVRNVDCYPTDIPGAVQHNAWWDALALRRKLSPAAALKSRARTLKQGEE